MKADSGHMRLSATDLANHLGCHHLTSLDLAVALGTRSAPIWHSPNLWVLRERGFEHENAYLKHLAAQREAIVDLRDIGDDERAAAETCAAVKRGAGVIAGTSEIDLSPVRFPRKGPFRAKDLSLLRFPSLVRFPLPFAVHCSRSPFSAELLKSYSSFVLVLEAIVSPFTVRRSEFFKI
jgi:hypothetical protein